MREINPLPVEDCLWLEKKGFPQNIPHMDRVGVPFKKDYVRQVARPDLEPLLEWAGDKGVLQRDSSQRFVFRYSGDPKLAVIAMLKEVLGE